MIWLTNHSSLTAFNILIRYYDISCPWTSTLSHLKIFFYFTSLALIHPFKIQLRKYTFQHTPSGAPDLIKCPSFGDPRNPVYALPLHSINIICYYVYLALYPFPTSISEPCLAHGSCSVSVYESELNLFLICLWSVHLSLSFSSFHMLLVADRCICDDSALLYKSPTLYIFPTFTSFSMCAGFSTIRYSQGQMENTGNSFDFRMFSFFLFFKNNIFIGV